VQQIGVKFYIFFHGREVSRISSASEENLRDLWNPDGSQELATRQLS